MFSLNGDGGLYLDPALSTFKKQDGFLYFSKERHFFVLIFTTLFWINVNESFFFCLVSHLFKKSESESGKIEKIIGGES